MKKMGNQLYEQLKNRYRELFDEDAMEIYRAPGRTEICGNHTDHQLGKVLAGAVNLEVLAATGIRNDDVICVVSEGYGKVEISVQSLEHVPGEEGNTRALIRGVAAYLSQKGWKLGGFNAYITSEVPQGSGLSSSAAFEVLIGAVISGLFNEGKIPKETLALAGQYAENVYFGKPCGLMDQMACACGKLVTIDFENPEKPEVRALEGDFGDYVLCITNTGGSHADLTEDYAAIPAEMKRVASCFGKMVLREVDEKTFYGLLSEVRTFAGDRAVLRAMHFFEEEKRVDALVQALEAKNVDKSLKIIEESGNSSFKYLQNVSPSGDVDIQSVAFALAISEKILNKLESQGVCRVHGGGFAGTIQTFVEKEKSREYANEMNRYFGEGACQILSICPEGAGKVIE